MTKVLMLGLSGVDDRQVTALLGVAFTRVEHERKCTPLADERGYVSNNRTWLSIG